MSRLPAHVSRAPHPRLSGSRRRSRHGAAAAASAAAVACCASAFALACDLPYAPGADDYAEDLLRRKGGIAAVDTGAVDTVATGTSTPLVIREFTVTSTSGLVVRGRSRVPLGAGPSDRRPLVVLLGGIQRGGEAIYLIPGDLPQVGAALWYPDALEADDAADALRKLDDLAELAWDIPASVLLALDYLAMLPEVDPGRIALVGASFGGFFAPAAAATDRRIANLGLLYAGGDLAGLMASHLEERVPPAAAILGAEMAALRLQRLEPIRYMADVAPRPVLLVNGSRDDLVVRSSAEALIRATRPPKDVVWLPTGHLDPANEPLLRELVDTALSRLPVLRAP